MRKILVTISTVLLMLFAMATPSQAAQTIDAAGEKVAKPEVVCTIFPYYPTLNKSPNPDAISGRSAFMCNEFSWFTFDVQIYKGASPSSVFYAAGVKTTLRSYSSAGNLTDVYSCEGQNRYWYKTRAHLRLDTGQDYDPVYSAAVQIPCNY